MFLFLGTEFGSPFGSGFEALVGVSDSEYLTFVSSSSEGATSPSSLVSLDSELSLSPSIFSLNLVMEDLSLSIASLLSSVLGQFGFAPLGVLASGEAELVLLFVFMKSLRSFPRPTFNFEYLRSVGPDLRRRVPLGSWFLVDGPERPLLSSFCLRSPDHASDLLLNDSISAARSNSLAMHSWRTLTRVSCSVGIGAVVLSKRFPPT